MTDTTLKGRRIQGGVRPSKTIEKARVCASSECGTKLSKYNRREFCYAHAPVKFPRVRGRVSADGAV